MCRGESKMPDECPKNVPRLETRRTCARSEPIIRLTTESNTGKKILAVLRLDVTSVKSPLIIMISRITAARGTPARNPSARATLADNCDAFEKQEFISSGAISDSDLESGGNHQTGAQQQQCAPRHALRHIIPSNNRIISPISCKSVVHFHGTGHPAYLARDWRLAGSWGALRRISPRSRR